MTVESVTTLTVCILVKGRDILLDHFRNEDITKGVLNRCDPHGTKECVCT